MEVITRLSRILSLVASSQATESEFELISFEINEFKKYIKLKGVNINIDQVVETVRQYYDLPEDYYINKTRKREYVIARQMCAKILLDNTKYSLTKIGRYFNKDHATIIHSKKTIENLTETNPKILTQYNELTNIISRQLLT